MSRVFYKDILRSMRKGWKRLLSILIITVLGMGMLTGLYASCLDMYYSADVFFDQQNLFDIRILSTLGLTREDIRILEEMGEVETAEGGYSETVSIDVNSIQKSAEMTLLSGKGLNLPYLLEGTLPVNQGEIAVTQKYVEDSGKSIGATITIAEEPTFSNATYLITGVVLNPMDIQSDGAGSVFRPTASADYTFFVTEADVDIDIFTVAYLTLSGTKEMNSYSREYEDTVDAVINNIESRIKTQREKARYASVLLEARTKIKDAESTVYKELGEAEEEFANAWREITDGKQELSKGQTTLTRKQKEAEKKISEARAELEAGKQKLAESEQQLIEGELLLADNELVLEENARSLAAGKQQLALERQKAEAQFTSAEQQFAQAERELDTAMGPLEEGIADLRTQLGDTWPESQWNTLVNAVTALAAGGADDEALATGTSAESTALASVLMELGWDLSGIQENVLPLAIGMGKISGARQVLDTQKLTFSRQKEAALQQLAEGEAKLAEGEAQISAGFRMIASKKEELAEGRAQLETGKIELAEGEEKLKLEEARAKTEIADAWRELEEGKQDLEEGESLLIEQEQEFLEKKEEALESLNQAYAELDDIDMTKWYIQNRTSLESYSSLDSDLSSIEAIGRIFPALFLLVAILMSLTTMTRMVEEERGLIGTYKALGFGSFTVYGKYLSFAFIACLLGGFLGDIVGFILMPRFVSVILEELYILPQYYLRFDALYGIGGILLFMAAIMGATALACHSELSQMPAALLRPKAPRTGSRVLLERIPFIWNRLKFLNKVTVRNLFRYKKRLFMTIGGIMGCTALILCGFAIKDSVTDLAPKQYSSIYRYDLMAVFQENDNEKMLTQLMSDENMKDFLNIRIETIKLMNSAGKSEKVQLLVIPHGASTENYIHLEDLNQSSVSLNQQGVIITQNAIRILGLKTGDTVSLQNIDLAQYDATVSDVVRNYLGNNVYMTQALYESLFGTYSPNAILAHLSDTCTDPGHYAEELLDYDSVLSAVSTAAQQEDFGFDLIHAVVLLLIVMAGGLAFAVLFTLSNTNISERIRELATIKVLGFYDKEVYQYVNKETLILTGVGVLIGLPVGRILSGFLTVALNMPSIHFAVHIEPVSYVLSAAITFLFALAVNRMTNRSLHRINMVEALKSVE